MCFAHSTWCHPLYQSCEVGRFSLVIYMFGNGDTSQSDRVFSLLLKVLWQKLKPHGGWLRVEHRISKSAQNETKPENAKSMDQFG